MIIMGGGLVEVFGLDFIGYGVCPALVLHFCWNVLLLNLFMFACYSYIDKLLDASESGNGLCQGRFIVAPS